MMTSEQIRAIETVSEEDTYPKEADSPSRSVAGHLVLRKDELSNQSIGWLCSACPCQALPTPATMFETARQPLLRRWPTAFLESLRVSQPVLVLNEWEGQNCPRCRIYHREGQYLRGAGENFREVLGERKDQRLVWSF